MSTDTDGARDGDGDRMEKIDVRVPTAVLKTVAEEYARRGYASRSEAIRDWLNPSPQLSKEMLADLKESRKQRERGETVSTADARERRCLSDVDDE